MRPFAEKSTQNAMCLGSGRDIDNDQRRWAAAVFSDMWQRLRSATATEVMSRRGDRGSWRARSCANVPGTGVLMFRCTSWNKSCSATRQSTVAPPTAVEFLRMP